LLNCHDSWRGLSWFIQMIFLSISADIRKTSKFAHDDWDPMNSDDIRSESS
jgi:hypothetical protein